MTVADNGTTVSLVVGQQLTVDLAPGPGEWDRPTLSGSGLRLVSVTGGYPQLGTMRAVYRATDPGTATLSSSTDLPCLHARPRCLVAQRLWRVQFMIRSGSA
ncbi:MAG: hypothetical protein J2P28_08680 [Actinobacteria bacterium]|nr:hypothetical protein [Actinomycetota bacterium]